MEGKENDKKEGQLGRTILEVLKKYEDRINQIEVVNDVIETHGSVRLRSIRMAQSLKARGIKKGDVILFGAVNHNDLSIAYLGTIYLGAIPVGLAVEMKHAEIKHIASIANPSFVFADPSIAPSIQKVLQEIDNQAHIVTFGIEKCGQFDNFSDYIKETGTEESFECEDVDPKNTIAVLACSSGTTGLPKLVALSHYSIYFIIVKTRLLSEEEKMASRNLNFSPIYWMSGILSILGSCLNGTTRIQSIKPFSPIEFDKASKVYKATAIGVSQIIICSLMKYAEDNKVTFPSFTQIFTGGSSVSEDALENMKKLAPNARILVAYGATEISLISVCLEYKKGSCGKPLPFYQWKIVDVNTEEKLGPNKEGELRLKTSISFMSYYNNPEATKAAFDEEGYYKTGDLLYYDEDGYFYIVDRIKELIKYRNYQMSSTELENLINDIPGVFLSAVVGIPHPEDGEHPMAFVQLETGASVSKDEIKNFVKENMSDCKQLRAGVVFMASIPTTYSGKVNRRELRQLKMEYIKNK